MAGAISGMLYKSAEEANHGIRYRWVVIADPSETPSQETEKSWGVKFAKRYDRITEGQASEIREEVKVYRGEQEELVKKIEIILRGLV